MKMIIFNKLNKLPHPGQEGWSFNRNVHQEFLCIFNWEGRVEKVEQEIYVSSTWSKEGFRNFFNYLGIPVCKSAGEDIPSTRRFQDSGCLF